MSLPGNIYLGQGFGLEEIQVAIWDKLIENLNDSIAEQESSKSDLDRLVYQRLNQEYIPVTIERIDINNFHLGSKPSLIEGNGSQDEYPCISVVADDTRPDVNDDVDQGQVFSDGVYIDIVVKSTELEGEYVCQARVNRTANAVHNVIQQDETFSGVLNGLSTPSCFISPVFRRNANAKYGTGESLHLQVARIEYGTTRFSNL